MEKGFKKEQNIIFEDVDRLHKNTFKELDVVTSSFKSKSRQLITLKKSVRAVEIARKRRTIILKGLSEKQKYFNEEIKSVTDKIENANELNAIYTHILSRIKLEESVTREKISVAERKQKFHQSRIIKNQALKQFQHSQHKHLVETTEKVIQQIKQERALQTESLNKLKETVQAQKFLIKERLELEDWKHRIKGFAPSSNLLKTSNSKLYKILCVEKLLKNTLQKVATLEELKSKKIEEKLHKLKILTGSNEADAIIKKYMNKDEESDYLLESISFAENQLNENWHENAELCKEFKSASILPEQTIEPIESQEKITLEGQDAIKFYKHRVENYKELLFNLTQVRRWIRDLLNLIAVVKNTNDVLELKLIWLKFLNRK